MLSEDIFQFFKLFSRRIVTLFEDIFQFFNFLQKGRLFDDIFQFLPFASSLRKLCFREKKNFRKISVRVLRIV